MQAAKAQGYAEPKPWCDKLAGSFKELATLLNLQAGRFLRTTDPDHAQAVQHLWRKLAAKGDIYRGVHRGWYCVAEECFYPESRLRRSGDGWVTAAATEGDGGGSGGKRVEWVEEPALFFRLSRYRDSIRQWWQTAMPIVPASRLADLEGYLETGLPGDLCVSRQCSWGLPVPEDPGQTIYVWLDALTNYLTVTGYPTRSQAGGDWIHVVGKDILK